MAMQHSSSAQFDFGRVTSRIFDLIGRNFVPFFVLSLIFVGLPSVVLLSLIGSPEGIADPNDPTAALSGAVWSRIMLASVISLVASVVLQGALTRASLDDLGGKGVRLNTALSAALALLLPLIGLGIIVGLGIMVGLVLLIIPGIYLSLRWAVAAPVLVSERAGVFQAMERSAKLTEGHRWAILGLAVIYLILVLVVNFAIGAVIGAVAAPL
jgi:hypothetical protein